jgi:hypothetical protein
MNMNVKTLSRSLIVIAALVATNSFAASHAAGEMKAADMMKMPMVDKNKDGMVSRAEYLEMAGKVFDMKAKEMKGKDGMMTADHYAKFLKDLESRSGQ